MNSIVCDVDGVVINLVGSVARLLQAKGYTDFTQDRVLTYDFNKSLRDENVPKEIKDTAVKGEYYLNTTRAEIFSCFTDEHLYDEVEFYDKEELNKYIEFFGKYREVSMLFHTVSATKHIANLKDKVLRDNLRGDYTILHSIDNGYNKSIIMDSIAVIEDSAFQFKEYLLGGWFENPIHTFYLVNSTYLANDLTTLLLEGIDVRDYNVKVVQSVKYALEDIAENLILKQ